MTDVESLQLQRTAIIAQLGSLPISSSVSEGGRSISVDRQGLLAQLKAITELIAQLAGPYIVTSTGRPYP